MYAQQNSISHITFLHINNQRKVITIIMSYVAWLQFLLYTYKGNVCYLNNDPCWIILDTI